MDRLGRAENRQIGIHQCHGNGYSQGFAYQNNKQIVFHYSDCLTLAKPEDPIEENEPYYPLANDPNYLAPGTNTTNHVVLRYCSPHNGTKWDYDEHVGFEFCIQFCHF